MATLSDPNRTELDKTHRYGAFWMVRSSGPFSTAKPCRSWPVQFDTSRTRQFKTVRKTLPIIVMNHFLKSYFILIQYLNVHVTPSWLISSANGHTNHSNLKGVICIHFNIQERKIKNSIALTKLNRKGRWSMKERAKFQNRMQDQEKTLQPTTPHKNMATH